MEVLTAIISFILLIALIGSPILILFAVNKRNIKFKFSSYLAFAIVSTVFIILVFAWWMDTSDQILLSHYGYDFDAWNDTERLANVSEENLDSVKKLESSMMGIGWTLKAIMGYIFYSPYLLVVYLIANILRRNKKELTPNIV